MKVDARTFEVAKHRGLSIMMSVADEPVSWKITVRIGELKGDDLDQRLPTVTRTIDKPVGLLNYSHYVILPEAAQMIDQRAANQRFS